MWTKRFYNRLEDLFSLQTYLHNRARQGIRNFLSQCISRYENIKVTCTLKCTFRSLSGELFTRHLQGPLNINFITALSNDEFDRYMTSMKDVFENEIEMFNEKGTGGVLERIHYLQIDVARFRRTRAGKYIELGKSLKCVINPKNENDDECFKWCMLIAKHWDDVTGDHRERITKYKQWQNELNFNGIEFPVHLDKITKFEKQNPEFAVNVFGYNS